MGVNKKVMMKVALALFLMAFSVEARFDPNTFLAQVMVDGDPNYITKSTTSACTKSMPPQCSCWDIGETCHSACKTCICTRSIPPQCHCADTTNFCYDACSNDAKAHN